KRGERHAHKVRLGGDLGEHALKNGRARELLLAGRGHDQGRRRPRTARDEREESEARLVGPVDVLQAQRQGPWDRELLDKLSDAFEKSQEIVARRREVRRADLRQQTRELRAPDRRKTLERLDFLAHLAAAKGVDPGTEGQDLLALVAAPQQHAGTFLAGVRTNGRHEGALTDTGLADNYDDPAKSAADLVNCAPYLQQLSLASNQRPLVHGSCLARAARRAGEARFWLRSLAHTLLEDVLIQSSRLGLGLSAQLAPEQGDADLVLLQRGASPALPRIETH